MDANCPRLLMIIAVAPLPRSLARSLISIPAYCRLARKKPFPSLVRPTADAVITLRASSFTNEFIIAATAATEKRTKRTEGAARSRMRTSHSNPFRRLTFAFKSPFGEMEALLFKYCIKALSINLLADFRESRAFLLRQAGGKYTQTQQNCSKFMQKAAKLPKINTEHKLALK